MNTIRTVAPLCLALGLALGLVACSDSTEYVTTSGAVAPAAATPADPYVDEVAPSEPPQTTTARLVASPGFDFASARDLPFALDVPEARGTNTSLNICTDYAVGGNPPAMSFDVDYGSCVLRTTMVDGYHEGVLALGNQHEAVLAVVWFKDPAVRPVYRELKLEN